MNLDGRLAGRTPGAPSRVAPETFSTSRRRAPVVFGAPRGQRLGPIRRRWRRLAGKRRGGRVASSPLPPRERPRPPLREPRTQTERRGKQVPVDQDALTGPDRTQQIRWREISERGGTRRGLLTPVAVAGLEVRRTRTQLQRSTPNSLLEPSRPEMRDDVLLGVAYASRKPKPRWSTQASDRLHRYRRSKPTTACCHCGRVHGRATPSARQLEIVSKYEPRHYPATPQPRPAQQRPSSSGASRSNERPLGTRIRMWG